MDTPEKRQRIQAVLEDLKAVDPVVIDLDGKSILADDLVIVTATSNTHAKAMMDALSVRLKAQGIRVEHVERDPGHTWIVMDYGDVVVHIFQEEERRYYDLEELWGASTGPRKEKPAPPRALPARAAPRGLRYKKSFPPRG